MLTSVEIAFTMLIHLIGAISYAVTVSSLVSICKEWDDSTNQVGHAIAKLSDFLDDCNVPQNSQDKFVSNYLMQSLSFKDNRQKQQLEPTSWQERGKAGEPHALIE